MTKHQSNNNSPADVGVAGISGKLIGISISESSDLHLLGLGTVHLQDAEVEFARYLLASGAKLAYGGDLRKDGFTDILLELVLTHRKSGLKPYECIQSYISWPIHLSLTPAQRAKYNQTATFHALPPPPFLKIADPNTRVEPNTAEHRYIWAHCLSAMREEINRNVDARLLLGGKVYGYTGKYPGLLEEAYLALRDNKPLYLIGGFGGCTKAIIEGLQGETPLAFTEVEQLKDQTYKQMVAIYNRKEEEKSQSDRIPIDYAKMITFLHGKGGAALNNGLTQQDNERLFETKHIPEMVALVLKGLRSLVTH